MIGSPELIEFIEDLQSKSDDEINSFIKTLEADDFRSLLDLGLKGIHESDVLDTVCRLFFVARDGNITIGYLEGSTIDANFPAMANYLAPRILANVDFKPNKI